MSRIVLIDAQIIVEIEKGNVPAANRLKQLLGTGEVYLSHQAKKELINDANPESAAARRQLFSDLRLTTHPDSTSAKFQSRAPVYDANIKHSGFQEADVMVAAEAKSLNAEVWSFDKAFRRERVDVVKKLFGVKVAAESHNIANMASQLKGKPVPKHGKWRTARNLMGLKTPFSVTAKGDILNIPRPAASKPTTPAGAAPVNSGRGSARVTAGTQSPAGKPAASKFTARTGTPDMDDIPSDAPGLDTGKADVHVGVLEFVNWVLRILNDKQQESRAKNDIDAIASQIARQLEADPTQGALVLLYYEVPTVPDMARDSVMQPGNRYAGLLGPFFGRTQDEARKEMWTQQKAIAFNQSQTSTTMTREYWKAPPQPLSVTHLATPFRKVALGTFASGDQAKLQLVSWNGAMGFDDEVWEPPVQLVAGKPVRFFILQPPDEVFVPDASGPYTVQIPVVARASAEGGDVEVVDMDPGTPLDVTAAMIFPADEASEQILVRGPTLVNDSGLRQFRNLDKLRWARPENIKILKRL